MNNFFLNKSISQKCSLEVQATRQLTNHVYGRKSYLRNVYSSDAGVKTGSDIPLPGKIVESSFI